MAKSEAMCENETEEGGVIFKELCAVRRDVVDRGSGSEGSCDAPGILLASGSRVHVLAIFQQVLEKYMPIGTSSVSRSLVGPREASVSGMRITNFEA